MGQYSIYKDGKQIADGIIVESSKLLNMKWAKERLKKLNGNTLHIINGDVINVYHNKNNRVTFSHTFTREGR